MSASRRAPATARLALGGRRGRGFAPVGLLALVTCAVLLFALPLGALGVLSVSPHWFGQPGGLLTFHAYGEALGGATRTALLHSLEIGAASGGLALLVGVPIAWSLERFRLPGQRLWEICLWALLLAPTYLVALGLELITQAHGPLQAVVGGDPRLLRSIVLGPAGVVWVLGMRGLPLAVLALRSGMAGLGQELVDSSRVHAVPPWRRRAATLSALAPGLCAAFAIVFAETISDFGVASTLAADAHFQVATNTIYEQVSTFPVDFAGASATSGGLMVLIALALAVQARGLRGGGFATIGGRTRPRAPSAGSLSRATLGVAAMTVLFTAALGVPSLALLATSFLSPSGNGQLTLGALTLRNYSAVLSDQGLLQPLFFSLRMAAVSAIAATILGTAVAPLLVRRHRRLRHHALDLALLATVGIPSIVIAVGFLFAYNLPVVYRLLPIYGTSTLLLFGYIAGMTPIAARLTAPRQAQLQGGLAEAARVHGRGPVAAWCRTALPLLAPSLVRGWSLVFAVVMFELPLSDVLHPPGVPPLAVAIAHQLRYDYATGTALTALGMLTTLTAIGLVAVAYRVVAPAAWQQLYRRRAGRGSASASMPRAWLARAVAVGQRIAKGRPA
jgi:iron(III) transport system permease protein